MIIMVLGKVLINEDCAGRARFPFPIKEICDIEGSDATIPLSETGGTLWGRRGHGEGTAQADDGLDAKGNRQSRQKVFGKAVGITFYR
jgi:hypothetical protein